MNPLVMNKNKLSNNPIKMLKKRNQKSRSSLYGIHRLSKNPGGNLEHHRQLLVKIKPPQDMRLKSHPKLSL